MTNPTWLSYLKDQGLKDQGATIDESGEISGFRGVTGPSETTTPHPRITALTEWGMLGVIGPDTEKFLQGQLTCDVAGVNDRQTVLGAACTPQGRMYTSFRLLLSNRNSEPQYLMRMRTGLIEATRAALAKYIVFFKSEILAPGAPAIENKEANGEWVGLGCWGKGTATALSQVFQDDVPLDTGAARQTEDYLLVCICAETERFECWAPVDAAIALWPKLTQWATPTGTDAWHMENIRTGLGEVSEATTERFIPQMLNYQHIGAISFDKGCYTGQEIVARTQYRGKTKRAMAAMRLQPTPGSVAPLSLNSGDELTQTGQDRAVATLVEVAKQGTDHCALTVVQVELLDNPNLTLCCNGADFDVEWLTLPYAND